jgi:hypothetical protein
MSAGSSNSNLGYGGQYPYVTKSAFVNATSTNNPLMFGSNQRPTSCMKGGRKRKYYRTPLYKSMRRRKNTRHRKASRRGRLTRRRHSRSFKGGYAQYQNNMPNTPNYSVAGNSLSSNNLALANPPPYSKLPGGCVDNYNRYTNSGFPSKGH